MHHRIRGCVAGRGLALGCGLVVATAGCSTVATHPGGRSPQVHREAKTILTRGRLPDGRRWQLAAFVQNQQLGLDLEEPSGRSDSGQVGFSASRNYSHYWSGGSGPGNSIFYYGPVPWAAISVRLTAPRHHSLLVRTAPIPAGHGLPRGRFFVVRPPGPVTVSWTVVPLDAAGHPVAFTAF